MSPIRTLAVATVALAVPLAARAENKEVASVDPSTLSVPLDVAPAPIPPTSDEAAKPKSASSAAPAKLGIGFGITLASAYNFRGQNLYKDQHQLDQALQVAPWASYTVPKTGLTLTYYSSYQATGSAAAANRKAGISHEQDFTAAYRVELPAHLALTPGFTTYVYPFATKEAAGTTTPVWVEPWVDLLWQNGVVDVDLTTTYFHGAQSALKDYRYGYLHAQLSRTATITPWVGVETAVGYGHKLYVEKVTQNRDDVSARIGVPFTVKDAVLKPAVNWAWTDLSGRSMGQEYFLFGSLDASYAL
jgi:hypothetical protein